MRDVASRAEANKVPTFPRCLISGVISLLLVGSVFQAAAVFSIKTPQGFTAGVTAYWLVVPISLFVAIWYWRWAKIDLGVLLPRDIRIASLCLLVFAAYGVVSAFILPFVFHGIKVVDPRLGITDQYLNPSTLNWSLSNAGQAAYMLMNSAVFLLLATAATERKIFARAYNTLVGTAFLVLGFAVFQHISVHYAPNGTYAVLYAVTHSNPAASSYPVTDPRTTSFFLEPSFFAGYAAAMSIMGLNAYLFKGGRVALALCALAFYGILTSESTVGMLAFPAGLVLTGGILAARRARGLASPSNSRARSRFLVSLVALGCVFILFWQESAVVSLFGIPTVGQTVPPAAAAGATSATSAVGAPAGVTQAASPPTAGLPAQSPQPPPSSWLARWTLGSRTWEDRLLSLQYRFWADGFSVLTIPIETSFLGAGLGSNRPSSFIAYVISNLGLPGMLAFTAFVLVLARSFWRRLDDLGPIAIAMGLGFCTYLLSMCGGLPDPNWPPFLWIFAGLTVAGMVETSGDSKGLGRA